MTIRSNIIRSSVWIKMWVLNTINPWYQVMLVVKERALNILQLYFYIFKKTQMWVNHMLLGASKIQYCHFNLAILFILCISSPLY